MPRILQSYRRGVNELASKVILQWEYILISLNLEQTCLVKVSFIARQRKPHAGSHRVEENIPVSEPAEIMHVQEHRRHDR